jgi:septum formation protein
MKRKFFLASSSPRRKELLNQIGLKFQVLPSNYKEDMTARISNIRLAKVLSYGKAEEVANKIKSGVVIGSDTFIEYAGERIGKPKDNREARDILKMISGRVVKIYSGLAIIDVDRKKDIVDCEITHVKIKKLNEKEIINYIKTGEPLDKAGAFAIQGKGAVFVEKINGCYSNVIGLPLYRLYKNLQKLDIDIW